MTIESGTRVDMTYVAEVTHGTTPGSPTMKKLRATVRNINPEIDALESEEVDSSRQETDVRHGFNKVTGSAGFQLGLGDFDDMLQYLLGGTWTAVSVGTADFGCTAPDQITRASGSFVTELVRPGDTIVTSSFSNSENNGVFTVASVDSATQITIVEQTLVTEAETSGRTISVKGKRLDIGTTLTTMTVERRFLGLDKYQVFKGVTVNDMALNVQPSAIVGGTFTLLGMDPTTPMSGTSLDSSPTAVSTNSPFSSFSGILGIDGAEIAIVTGIELNIANNRQVSPVVFSKISPDVFEGVCRVTGTLTAFFESVTLYNNFINEDEVQIAFRLDDVVAGEFMSVAMNRVKFTGAPMDPGQEGPVVISLPFRALKASTANGATSIQIQRSNT